MKQHLHRFRLGVLPAVWFLCCVVVTLWLWERAATRGTVFGEVETQQVWVSAGMDGLLLSPTDAPWQLFDRVTKGQVIAVLDDAEIQAQINTIKAEATALMSELEATRAESAADHLTLVSEHEKERLRVSWEVERRRIEMLTAFSELKSLKTELDGAQAGVEILEKVGQTLPGTVGQLTLQDRRRERDTFRAQFEAAKPVYLEAKRQFELETKRLAEFGSLEQPAVEALLAPLRASITVQERLVDELEATRQKLIITAPMDGVISEILSRPGQYVGANTPILAISRPDSQYIISYVREQHIPLREGMEVGLRLRGEPGGLEYTSTIQTVGPQVAPVPPRQLVDPSTLEWATPIRIEIPSEMQAVNLRPGQLVQVIFRHPLTQRK